jgi:GNAT superfamily N-acetyltransferase
MKLEVAFASTPTDCQAAIFVLQEVSRWLEGKNQALWNPAQFSESWAKTHLERGELVLARVDGVVAAVMLLTLEDRDVWADFPASEAVFVHKLAVSREFAGRGLAQKLLEFAATQARGMRRDFVRLDSVQRPALERLYIAAGFEIVDQKMVFDCAVWRYQRRV